MIHLHAYKMSFFNQTNLNDVSILFSSLLVQVGHYFLSSVHTLVKPSKTWKACLRCSVHPSVHFLVAKYFCMVRSFKS